MFTVQELVQPQSLEEAYSLLLKRRNNTILGGCAFLKMGSKRIGTAIDLSKLELDYIRETDDGIEIGAMTTFRELETNLLLNKYFDGVLPASVRDIIGVQFRNVVTVGASVYSRYGFSDLLTALLALNTDVVLHKAGRISLEEFVVKGSERDILEKLIIKKDNTRAVYGSLRNSRSDYAVLNISVSLTGNKWKIIAGARPHRAAFASDASGYLSSCELNEKNIEEAARLASEELSFGSNMRGSGEYRRNLCRVLVKRAIYKIIAGLGAAE